MFTGIIAAATVLYSSFAGWQLYEIHEGAKDTHTLAEAAKKQADKAETISESIKLAVKAMQDSANAATSSAATAKQILESSTRPYMGSDTASLDNNPTGHHLSYGFHMKNFSSAPAYNAVFRWCPSITGYPHTGESRIPDKPITVYPGQGFGFVSDFSGAAYDAVMKGTAIFGVTIYGKYDGGDKKHYTYCQKHRFSGGGFIDLGECDFGEVIADIKKNGCR